MAFDGIQITNRGRNLLAKAEAGQTKITYTKFSAGDGKLAGQMPVALKALVNEKISFPVSRLKIQNENVVVPGFEFSNQGVSSGFFFREVGLWATDPDLGEILYAYANSGEGAEYIDAQNTSAVLKKLFNFELTVSNTAQVTVVVDDTIIYATPQDVADALKKSKDYTDAAILGVKVPDASTTQKGVVQLTNSTNSTSETLAPTAKALKTVYDVAASKMAPYPDSIEMRQTATTPGPTFIDFHSSGTGNDYDSRIIAEGGTTTAGNGKITIQAATTVLSGGGVETSGQLWVAKNTQFGNTSNLSLPIGDSDTGLNWFGDGGVDFYSNNSKAAALSDGVFKYYDTDGSSKILRNEINNLKQLSVDKFTKIANAINGKGGNANASMTGDEFAAAITNLPVKRFASGNFNGQTASGTNPNDGVSINLSVNGLAFSPSRVFIRARFSDTNNYTRQVDAIVMADSTNANNIIAYGWRGNYISFGDFFRQVTGGFTLTLQTSKIDQYAGSSTDLPKIMVYQWWAYE